MIDVIDTTEMLRDYNMLRLIMIKPVLTLNILSRSIPPR